jgi:DNA-binding HxlR family transcriptional regulator
MTKTNKKNAIASGKECAEKGGHKTCPVFLTLGLIANKWSIQLLNNLLHAEGKTLRFSQLQKALTGISQRELSKHLREFEKSGIVNRKVYPQVPPRVEYTLTDLGYSLFEPIDALASWAEKNGAKVQKKRADFETKNPSKSKP